MISLYLYKKVGWVRLDDDHGEDHDANTFVLI